LFGLNLNAISNIILLGYFFGIIVFLYVIDIGNIALGHLHVFINIYNRFPNDMCPTCRPAWPVFQKETLGALAHTGAHLDLSAFSSWEVTPTPHILPVIG